MYKLGILACCGISVVLSLFLSERNAMEGSDYDMRKWLLPNSIVTSEGRSTLGVVVQEPFEATVSKITAMFESNGFAREEIQNREDFKSNLWKKGDLAIVVSLGPNPNELSSTSITYWSFEHPDTEDGPPIIEER